MVMQMRSCSEPRHTYFANYVASPNCITDIYKSPIVSEMPIPRILIGRILHYDKVGFLPTAKRSTVVIVRAAFFNKDDSAGF